MAKWQRGQMRMHKNHEWKSKRGYQIFVANRGEVRFDFPEKWHFQPDVPSPKETPEQKYHFPTMEFHDKQPPDDTCRLQVTIFQVPPGMDWTGLPLEDLFNNITDHPHDDTPDIVHGETHYEKRRDCELAWREGRYTDQTENRPAITRTCVARDDRSVPLFTMEFWVDDYDQFNPVWEELLRSLRLGDMVQDPRTGRVNPLDQRSN